jgi:hypothetical protein
MYKSTELAIYFQNLLALKGSEVFADVELLFLKFSSSVSQNYFEFPFKVLAL